MCFKENVVLVFLATGREKSGSAVPALEKRRDAASTLGIRLESSSLSYSAFDFGDVECDAGHFNLVGKSKC